MVMNINISVVGYDSLVFLYHTSWRHIPEDRNIEFVAFLTINMTETNISAHHSLTDSLTHGAEPFLRSCQLCSQYLGTYR
jgi:hypothetical protein